MRGRGILLLRGRPFLVILCLTAIALFPNSVPDQNKPADDRPFSAGSRISRRL
jgi:hypothetical protein